MVIPILQENKLRHREVNQQGQSTQLEVAEQGTPTQTAQL